MSNTVTVEIRNFAFHPARVEINPGDKVIWRNHDHMGHSALRQREPLFDTGVLLSGESSLPITFDAESDNEGFEYFCEPHPQMKGTVVSKSDK
ncbi:MAG: amicyanin [Mesorhizobium sp.]|uniref:plastocyanin/azurin family copper-binding protein n=1 Tax=unclassified Mesorhizobium TaxID=325217 RepID=UPI000FCBC72C|nr:MULTISPECIES: plastocyanin/azurin family copper-binding protein [unclassified Mesorhizobium]RUV53679.1 amicyanin [Mesorhizobium sp. M5C.F.Ca.IN.020.29.1.1]RWA98121.1 MAG: amicyanin [Mesorhizobium sp.]RWC24230.1 MAG: amicyanin [Mesorhizobium sp.]RWD85462.1 MAG: amicyanin [Mesorhizobium sp.]RWE53217.1 MAG: amicyanin [Mesorhizobium sp.]